MFINKYSLLSQNLLGTLNDDEYYDIAIEVGNDPDIKTFRAHMVILSCRSPYLRRILLANKNQCTDDTVHIKLPNILPEIFQLILRYIYGGNLVLENLDISSVIKILVAVNMLGLQELVPVLQSFLISRNPTFLEQNFNLIFQTCFENDSFLDLQNFCVNLLSKNPVKVFNLLNLSSITEKSLISLIRHENLQISVVQVWNHVLKWGLSNNSEISSDLSNFSNDDFNALKDTLKSCIPFIKFFELSSKEFLNNVLPYRQVLPEDLYIDLLKLFLNCNYRPTESQIIKRFCLNNFESKIITIKHIELIMKWIDKLEIMDKLKTLYEFNLIFRGSRDGFTPEKFHEICDNKFPTITIIKVKDSNEILGENIIDFILSRVQNEKQAINFYSRYGPSFGNGDLIIYGGSEHTFNNYANYCKKLSYEKQIRQSEKFSVEDYEIFQIKKFSFKNDTKNIIITDDTDILQSTFSEENSD
ncbi:carbohydrate-binding module family 13 protein [Rhizophagus clarus]|uniref:Carbohydrate-binding module family 13 protein n=1 Tax=Rhizophagus clarus TaxID=94130 RepID=A0A8H3QLQ8_9GLOM|nr:carbohydrate-binding module family 13 protein [Rhizophagus clarus]